MKLFAAFLFVLFLSSCQKQEDLPVYISKMVVEGSIEEGGFPQVLLTNTIPYFSDTDSSTLEKIILRRAKVSVSDGQTTEILTLMKDDTNFPPFIYKGISMVGELGKTYTLKVEFEGKILSAETHIPEKVKLNKIWFEQKPVNKRESMQLNISFDDRADQKNFYKIYFKIQGRNKRFIPGLLAGFDDKFFNGKTFTTQVNRGPDNFLDKALEPYFISGDTVMVKFSSLPPEADAFWTSFSDQVVNTGNPLAASERNLKSNIKGLGIGIWSGYGATVYRAVVK